MPARLAPVVEELELRQLVVGGRPIAVDGDDGAHASAAPAGDDVTSAWYVFPCVRGCAPAPEPAVIGRGIRGSSCAPCSTHGLEFPLHRVSSRLSGRSATHPTSRTVRCSRTGGAGARGVLPESHVLADPRPGTRRRSPFSHTQGLSARQLISRVLLSGTVQRDRMADTPPEK